MMSLAKPMLTRLVAGLCLAAATAFAAPPSATWVTPTELKALKDIEARAGALAPELTSLRQALAQAPDDAASAAGTLNLLERLAALTERQFGASSLELATVSQIRGRWLYEAADHAAAQAAAELALRIRQQQLGNDHVDAADSLYLLGAIFNGQGEFGRGGELMEQSLRIRESRLGPGHASLVEPLNGLGWSLAQRTRFAEARALHQRALVILEREAPDDDEAMADTLNFLAIIEEDQGAYEQALILQERSLALREKALGPQHRSVAQAVNNLALVHVEMGQTLESIPLLERALRVFEGALGPEHPEVAEVLHNLASVYQDLGRYAEALPLSLRSVAIDRKAGGEANPKLAQGLNMVSMLQSSLGQTDAALASVQQAISILEKTDGLQSRHYHTTLNNLGTLQGQRGDIEASRATLQRSLALKEASLGQDHPSVAVTLHALGTLDRLQGRTDSARAQHRRALEIREKALGAHHRLVGASLEALARVELAAGASDQALPLLARAERLAALGTAPEQAWAAQDALRLALAGGRHRDLAIFWGKQAVNTIQGIRVGLTGLRPDLQQGFLADKRPVYTGLADLLIDAGRLAEAQQVLAMLKDEELHDFLRRDASAEGRGEARAGRAAYVGGAERQAEARWRELNDGLAAIGRERGDLLRKAKAGLDEPQQRRLNEVEAVLVEANRRYDDFVAGLGREFAAEAAARQRELGSRQLELGSRQLDNLVTLQDTLREVGGDTVLLHYVVADRRVAIIVTTPEVQVARESAIAPEALNRLVQALRSALQARADVTGPARALHRVLIEPVLADIEQAGAKKLALSLDGTLRYVPFAALHDGRQFLVERFGLSVYTEAARGNLARRPRTDWAMTGLGLTRAVPGFEALPAVRAELEGIHGRVLPGEVYFDDQFTAHRLTEALTRQVPVLHIASHFSFRPGTDADSFLVLGDGGRMTLQEMRERRLRFGGVELLTLSACDTAMGGGRNENGAEVEGFGALAQRQGAQAVLATLWPVADQSTGRFMQQLYRTRQAGGDGGRLDGSKAQALRQTQLEFLRTPRYAHPYYWAPFILMGNWL